MPEDEHVRVFHERPVFSREQKAALWLLMTFGTLAFVFGMFYLWKHIADPFSVSYAGPRLLVGDEKEAEEVRAAKRTDTDKDGVNDYDELHVYKTSPYLADTDSDGVGDMAEIVSGGDPSCAPGDSCDVEVDDAQAATLDNTFIEDAAQEYGYVAGVDPAALANEVAVADLINSMSAAEIRALLLENGADAAVLDGISDEDLKALMIQVITEMQATGEVPTDLSAGSEAPQE